MTHSDLPISICRIARTGHVLGSDEMSAKDVNDATTGGRKPWKKPQLRSLRAGAAETGTGVKGDNQGGGNIHRS